MINIWWLYCISCSPSPTILSGQCERMFFLNETETFGLVGWCVVWEWWGRPQEELRRTMMFFCWEREQHRVALSALLALPARSGSRCVTNKLLSLKKTVPSVQRRYSDYSDYVHKVLCKPIRLNSLSYPYENVLDVCTLYSPKFKINKKSS